MAPASFVASSRGADSCTLLDQQLGDRKDIETQVLLFTEDAMVDSYVEGKLVSSLKGRRQLADAFGGYLALFDTVYHQNGQ